MSIICVNSKQKHLIAKNRTSARLLTACTHKRTDHDRNIADEPSIIFVQDHNLNKQKKPTNCGTRAADVLANSLAGQL